MIFSSAARVLAGILAVWLGLASIARAHPILQNPMWIEVTPEELKVRLHVSVRELGVIQGVPISPNGVVSLEMAEEAAPRHSQYVLDHLHFRADGLPIGGAVERIIPPETVQSGAEGPDQSYFVYELRYPLPQPPPAVLTLRQSMCVEFPSAPGVPWDLSYAYRFGRYGETPKRFGVLPREVEIRYETGFAPAVAEGEGAAGGKNGQEAAGAFAARVSAPAYLANAGGWLLLLAALALNVTDRREALCLASAAGGGFAAGFLFKSVGGLPFPGWLFPAFGGAGVLLVALDNIHRSGQPADVRRHILAAAFGGIQGLVASSAAAANGLAGAEGLAVFGLTVLAAGLAVFGAVLWGAGLLFRKAASPERCRVAVQILSLLLAAGGVYFLLRGMEIDLTSLWKRARPGA